MIDASADDNPVILKAGNKSTVLRAGKGGSTLIGSKAGDKFYGGDGIDYFVYTLGQGADAFYDVEPQDIISISGATRDQLTFKDSKNVVTVGFTNDSKSKLTINKVNSVDPITFDLDGELFTYGALPTGVTYDNNDKKTAIKVGATAADGVVVRAIDIVSTAKTLDGSAANGAVYLVGNDNANVIKAGAKGSTLYGGQGDYILLDGVTEIKDADVKVSASKVEVTINKQKLALDNPIGEINFVDSDGTVIYSMGVNFPKGASVMTRRGRQSRLAATRRMSARST